MSCKHIIPTACNTYDLYNCSYCWLESKLYYGYNPDVYNLAYDNWFNCNKQWNNNSILTRRYFTESEDFKEYYNLAKIELRTQKINSIL